MAQIAVPLAVSPSDQEVWASLQQAIANSSGFQSWKRENSLDSDLSLENQVQCYLRDTLATLAY